jgi:hypothetical protein
MEPTRHPTARIDDSGAHPHLTLADVHAALAYYYDHQDVIRAEWQEARELIASLRAKSDGRRAP